MGLRAKTAWIVGISVAAVVALLYLVLSNRNTTEFEVLERQDARLNLTRATNSALDALKDLETITLDWAVWDEAYEFTRGRVPDFEDTNINATSMGLLNLELFVIEDRDGRVLATRERTDSGDYRAARRDLIPFTRPERWLWKRREQFIVTSGLLVQGRHVYIVANAPVIRSTRLVLPGGRLTMARELDQPAILELARLTQLELEVYPKTDPNLPPERRTALERLEAGEPDVIQPISDERLAAYRLVSQPTADQALVVRAEMKRDMTREIRASNGRLLVSLGAVGLGTMLLALLLLERGVLSRLTRLARELAGLGAGTTRVSVLGKDELARVAGSINTSLERLEKSRAEAVRLEAEIERLRREELEMLVGERTAALEATRLELFERLALVAEFRDDETGQHTMRVGMLAAAIGKRLNLPEDEVARLRYAARLHDIGKIAIPDEILFKPSRLNTSEWSLMRSHAALGAQMLERSNSPLLEMARVIALTHHEHWDGAGYPEGLAAETIPLVGRIVAVADTFDALMSDRPYKPAWTLEQTVAEIQSASGSRFDPAVVRAFLAVIEAGEHGFGAVGSLAS